MCHLIIVLICVPIQMDLMRVFANLDIHLVMMERPVRVSSNNSYTVEWEVFIGAKFHRVVSSNPSEETYFTPALQQDHTHCQRL